MMRARAQKLHFVGYERRVAAGERVSVHVRCAPSSGLSVSAPLSEPTLSRLVARRDLVEWPLRSSLGYHFSMIADTTRNGCFERAIIKAVGDSIRAGEHVLDIGSGSGLLAMMAVRAGAKRVSSLEMVPAMAAVARHVIDANGMSGAIRVHQIKSTDAQPEELGGRAGLLVCERADHEPPPQP